MTHPKKKKEKSSQQPLKTQKTNSQEKKFTIIDLPLEYPSQDLICLEEHKTLFENIFKENKKYAQK